MDERSAEGSAAAIPQVAGAPRRRPARPSMADVGRAAGVSAQTVSRYFSDSGYVSTETRRRIAEAVQQLGYRQNRAAGSLRGTRTGTIGVLAVGELVHGGAEILTGLSQAAHELGLTLMTALIDVDFAAVGYRDEVRGAVDRLLAVPVDGIIASSSISGIEPVLEAARAEVPVIHLSEDPAVHERGRGASDSVIAGRLATEHLLALGHRHILHIAGPVTRREALDREAGYREAMAAVGADPSVIHGARSWSSPPGEQAGLVADPADFTAVFAANDEIALGFLSAMQQRGLSAPEDFSLVGVDDMPAARYFSPPLTTVRLDFRGLGKQTLRAMDARIRGGGPAPWSEISSPQLIIRRSTAAR